MLRLALAALHLLALGIGLGAVLDRAAALREPLDGRTLRRAFRADALWGAAAALWLATGLWRLFAGTEKATGYYMQNHVFYAKMGLFLLVFALELWPMVTLVRWRRRPSAADQGAARRIAAISRVQALVVIGIVVAAVAMARGYGAR